MRILRKELKLLRKHICVKSNLLWILIWKKLKLFSSKSYFIYDLDSYHIDKLWLPLEENLKFKDEVKRVGKFDLKVFLYFLTITIIILIFLFYRDDTNFAWQVNVLINLFLFTPFIIPRFWKDYYSYITSDIPIIILLNWILSIVFIISYENRFSYQVPLSIIIYSFLIISNLGLRFSILYIVTSTGNFYNLKIHFRQGFPKRKWKN